MNKELRASVKDALVKSIFDEFRRFGGYLNVRVVNLKKSDNQYVYDTILEFEDGSERHNDCEIDIQAVNQLITTYKII